MVKWENIIIRQLVWTLVFSFVIFSSILTSAEVAGPGWLLGAADPVTPEQAQAFYSLQERSQESPLNPPVNMVTGANNTPGIIRSVT